MSTHDTNPFTPSRRRLLQVGGLAAVGLVTNIRPSLAGAAPCAKTLDPFTAADFDRLGTCRLTTEQIPGPFPLDEQFDRRDITEGSVGNPMRLGLRVTDAACTPVSGAHVEIWHTDASGDYSAFIDGGGGKDDGPGTTFLRGTQTAGVDGIVEFHTITPGWYPDRTPHIHVRVRIGEATVLTSQLYFPDAHIKAVYMKPPYAQFGPPDTTNATDGFAGDPAAEGTLLNVAKGPTITGRGTVALINLGVDADARSPEN
jgi:protocatechuate 3,4-dioxygenase beta subunit